MSLPDAPAAVAAVIVAYNDAPSLRACIASLRKSDHPLRILVIDNSTTDAVRDEFSAAPDVEYRRSAGNLGFSRGCNAGIARSLESGADYTWLLNPDTEVEPGCLGAMIRAARAFPRAGIVGSRIHFSHAPLDFWYAGGRMSYLTGVGKHLTDPAPGTRETGYVTGCSMLIPNPVLRRVGGLDERIFMYQDDTEFCLRVRAAGYALVYEPAARMAHAVGPGMDWRRHPEYYLYFSIRNRPLISRRPMYRAYLHAFAWALAFAKFLRYAALPGVPGRLGKLRAVAWGAWDSLFPFQREARRFPALFRSQGRPG
jgi:GT2 family glycosyltransferase